jgi:hypothetical protein
MIAEGTHSSGVLLKEHAGGVRTAARFDNLTLPRGRGFPLWVAPLFAFRGAG